MPALHADEVHIDASTVRRLVDSQFPIWTDRPVEASGHGTDNMMFRIGDDLVARLPRTPGTAADVAKEQAWLPRLAPQLPVDIPVPVGLGRPGEGYPFAWSVYRWVPGDVAAPDTVGDWGAFGRDLAGFVRALHAVDLGGTVRGGALAWYRGEPLAAMADEIASTLRECRTLDGLDLDLDGVAGLWQRCLAVPQPGVPHVLTHPDLRLDNLIAREGRLAGVLDFGALSVGDPTAVHAAAWEWPPEARAAYREALALDDDTWLRATGWAICLGLLGVPYYWKTWPGFARAGVVKLRAILGEVDV